MTSEGQGDLVRWGLEVDGLNAEATRLGARTDRALQNASDKVERALRQLDAVRALLAPSEEQVHRIEEVARTSGEAAVRTDLLALNFQVEAARLGEDDRGLERVAHEIRTLSDRGARGASEIGELTETLIRQVDDARTAIARGAVSLGDAGEDVARGLRAINSALWALARARTAASEFAAGAAATRESRSSADTEAIRRLTAAVEVRERTWAQLAQASSMHLQRITHGLADEGRRALETGERLGAHLARVDHLAGLVEDADEIARRAKQLALSADLAAARSEDPAFALFAEEARRLSEHAEAAASGTQTQLAEARRALAPEVDQARARGEALQSIGSALRELLERLGEVPQDELLPLGEDMERAWREDRAAAERLAEALSQWGHVEGGAGRTGD